jgi:hypothetical protein
MSLEPNSLLASLLVSSVGFVLFSYGKKMRRFPHGAIGVVMLIYPYFVSSIPIMLAIAPVLLLVLWLLTRLGM